MEVSPIFNERVSRLFKWFARLAEERRAVWLVSDLARLRVEPIYGIKCFLLYANQREGASRGYGVAGIKAVAQCERQGRPLTDIPIMFRELYGGLANESHNPALDERLATFDVPSIVALVQRGDLAAAFDVIDIRGAG